MTVKELIEKLAEMPQDTQVFTDDRLDYDTDGLVPVTVVNYARYDISDPTYPVSDLQNVVVILARENFIPE